MIDRIVKEIELAYKNGLYMSALSLALMLPDICGKAEYPEDGVGNRYKKWFNKYFGDIEKSPIEEGIPTPYLSGEVAYQLRCSVLHSGTTELELEKIKLESCKIDRFIINTDFANSNRFTGNESVVFCVGIENKVQERIFTLSLRDFCQKITRIAKFYYEENRAKFDFLKFEVVHSADQVQLHFW